MIRREQTVVISKPIAEVFGYLARLENEMAWRSELLRILRVTEGPKGPGAKYSQRVEWLGHEEDATVEVVDFEPQRRIAYVANAEDLRSRGEYDLESFNGSTAVHVISELELRGKLAGAEKEVAAEFERLGDEDLEHLRDILEHRE